MKPTWTGIDRNQEMKGVDLPIDRSTLPLKEIARSLAERADELGLRWRLVPATVGNPGEGGVMRVVLDADTEEIDATTMIGRLPVGARVFVILSPPAGVHIVGFLGYDFPPSVTGEAIGRPRLITLPGDVSTAANSVALLPVPGMAFTVLPGGQYVARLRASYNGATAGDMDFSWSGPAGCVIERYILGIHPGDAGNNPAANFTSIRRSINSQQGAGVTAPVGGTDHSAFPGYWEDCWVKADTGGTVQLRINQRTANATPALIRSNSYIEVQRYR